MDLGLDELSAAPPHPWSRADVVLCGAATLLTTIGAAIYFASETRLAKQFPDSLWERWLGWESLPSVGALTVAGAALRRYVEARAVGAVLLIAGCVYAAVLFLAAITDFAYERGVGAAAYFQSVWLAVEPFAVVSPLILLPHYFPDGPL